MIDRLFASESGAGAATIVFLHGFGSWHGLWSDIARAVSRESRVLAYDLPGHAKSLAFPVAGQPAKLAARAILADLDRRGIERAHVVGHSMGGAIAALMALSQPERISTMTLLAPGGFGEEINGPLLRRYASAATEEEIRTCLAAMSGPGAGVDDRMVQALATLRAAPLQLEKLIEIAAAITRDDRQGVIPQESLAKLSMPVSVLWGKADPVLPYNQSANLPAAFALHSVPGAGHMLVEERPDWVLRSIRTMTG